MPTLRVLYASHTARVSGAEWWLLDTLGALPDTVEPVVATPPGRLEELVHELGIRTVAIAGTDGSLRLNPVHTSRALAELGCSGLQLARWTRRLRADIVHSNSIRIAVSAVAARKLIAAPLLAHVHESLPRGRVADATLRFISRSDLVLVNSEFTRERFLRAAPRSDPSVLYNAVDLERFDPAKLGRDEARAEFGLSERTRALGMVAQITPWKGQEEAIRMTSRLRERGIDVQLLLAGTPVFVSRSTRYDNRAYDRGLHALVGELGVADRVHFLGERGDVPRVLRALDMLLVPSWEEPFGRAVVEAMVMGVPVAATSAGGPPELVRDGEDGLLLPPRRPDAWAEALEPVLRDGPRLRAMGAAAEARARHEFGLERITGQLVDDYDRLMESAHRSPPTEGRPQRAADQP